MYNFDYKFLVTYSFTLMNYSLSGMFILLKIILYQYNMLSYFLQV